MASGLLFDPMRLLHLAPLITSTGSAMYSTTELIVNSAFLHPSIRKNADQVLPKWFSTVFNRGAAIVVSLITLTTSTAVANIYMSYNQSENGTLSSLPFSTKMYGLGLACALGHLVFIPWVSGSIQNLMEDKSKKGACNEMEDWLSVHRIRWAVADFPAWVCFLLAVLTTAGPL